MIGTGQYKSNLRLLPQSFIDLLHNVLNSTGIPREDRISLIKYGIGELEQLTRAEYKAFTIYYHMTPTKKLEELRSELVIMVLLSEGN
jgi:hypothetical protein